MRITPPMTTRTPIQDIDRSEYRRISIENMKLNAVDDDEMAVLVAIDV